MASEKGPGPNKRERSATFLRNAHAIGAVALFGLAAIAPPLAAGLGAAGAFAGLEAAGFDAAKRHYAKKRKSA